MLRCGGRDPLKPGTPNHALEQTRDSALRCGESVGCELLNLAVLQQEMAMRPLFSRNDWFIVVGVAALLLAVSLAVYSRKSLKWTGPDLLASANHYAMGVPPWLELNHFHLEPASQTIDLRSLPDTEKYSPRWRVQTMPLVASLIGCLVLSIMMVGVRRALCGRGGEEDGNRFLWGYGIGVLPGLALGAVAPTEPEWIGKLALALGVLPICVAIAAAVMRDYLRGVLLAFIVPVAIVWSQRIVDVFRSSHRVGGLPNADDLSVVVIFGAIYGLVAVTSTCVARLLHRTDKDAEQSLAAESRSCPAVLRIPWLRSAEGDR